MKSGKKQPGTMTNVHLRRSFFGFAMTNVWNRINVTTRQVAGEWAKSDAARKWKEKQVAAD
jgi:hypothetical protein